VGFERGRAAEEDQKAEAVMQETPITCNKYMRFQAYAVWREPVNDDGQS
jgi:hypothetical protein